MNDPILIQIDDEVREATPEEAAAILAMRESLQPMPGADDDDQ